jgi:sodium-dependent phosphate cotransporter
MAGLPEGGKAGGGKGTENTRGQPFADLGSGGSPNREMWIMIGQIILLNFVLYSFLVSIGMMGASFKLFGRDFARQLVETTANPVVGLFVGILATALVQSSSTTTSLTVGIVAAGGLTIEGAVPIVMGANIGTSVTNILVSMGHITRKEEFRRAQGGALVHDFFNWFAVLLLFPLELATGWLRSFATLVANLFMGVGGMSLANPLKAIVQPTVKWSVSLLGESPILVFIVSLVLMYLALKFLVDLAKGVVVKRAERVLQKYLFGAAGLSMLFGMVITVLVQSSSITTSLIIPLVGAGILTVEQIFPYTLGANVGTTVTAMLAALSTANIAAITIAFVHLFFNIAGIVLIYPIAYIRRIPIKLAQGMANMTSQSRGLAIVFVLVVFYAIPAAVIYFGR